MPRAMFVTDLDGTLLRAGALRDGDVEALEGLRARGILTVVATGRSLFSFLRSLSGRTPRVDYLVLSSGACIVEAESGNLLHSEGMTGEEAAAASEALLRLDLDFAVHEAVPENHRFLYALRSAGNPDMERRIRLYGEHCRPLRQEAIPIRCTQLVAIAPPGGGDSPFDAVLDALGDAFSVLRTTSPLDGASLWIEIFPRGVCKSSGAAWLAAREDVPRSLTAAVGNDWNDADLLRWAALPFVIEGSPPDLSDGCRTVPTVEEAASVCLKWLAPGWRTES